MAKKRQTFQLELVTGKEIVVEYEKDGQPKMADGVVSKRSVTRGETFTSVLPLHRDEPRRYRLKGSSGVDASGVDLDVIEAEADARAEMKVAATIANQAEQIKKLEAQIAGEDEQNEAQAELDKDQADLELDKIGEAANKQAKSTKKKKKTKKSTKKKTKKSRGE